MLKKTIPQRSYRARNWPEYNRALKTRGRLGLWIDQSTIENWNEPRQKGKNGRPKAYSDEAIKCALTIRLMFNLPLRATEGFLSSLFGCMNLVLSVPDYTLICKRQKTLGLPNLQAKKASKKPITDIVIDSTGVKVYGEGEWKVKVHGTSKRRKWRKVHIAIDPETGEIVAEKTTDNDSGDAEELPRLLDQIKTNLGKVLADGAYDTCECHEEIQKRNAQAVIPPRSNACLWPEKGLDHPRNKALFFIARNGSKAWKEKSGYHTRSLVETSMYRLKTIFTGRLKSRLLKHQKLECRLMCMMLNKLSSLGMPDSYPVSIA